MKHLFLNLVAIATTCCCAFKNFNSERIDKSHNKNQIDVMNDGEYLKQPILRLNEADRPEYTDKGHGDNKPEGAQKIDANFGLITGKLNTNNGWTQFWNSVGEKDEDWFVISTRETRQYLITFTQPGGSYKLTVYQYAGEGKKSDLVRVSYTYGGSFYVNLRAATYYFQVSCDDKKDIKKDKYYTVKYTDYKYDETFQLDTYNKTNYKVALWENDYIPSNIKRWGSFKQTICSTSSAGNGVTRVGFRDPIFNYNNGERYLDSVIYVWGIDEIKELSNILCAIDSEVKKKFASEQNLSITADVINNGASIALTITGLAKSSSIIVSSVCGVAGIAIAAAGIAVGLFKMFNKDNYQSELQKMIIRVQEALYFIPQIPGAVLCIPRYAYYTFSSSADGTTRTSSSAFYWHCTLVEDYNTYMPHYQFTQSYISQYQTFHKNGDKTMHGTITAFSSGQDFKNYIGV